MPCGKLEIRPANGGYGSKPSVAGSKSETNSNDKNSKFKTFWSFGHLDFDIVSNFGFRASSFHKIIAHVTNNSVKVI